MDTQTAIGEIVKLRAALQVMAAVDIAKGLFPFSAHVPNGTIYDYLIVGGGTAGCVVANRLSENPNNKVLLIEAGGDPPVESIRANLLLPLMGSSPDWNYTTEYSKPNPECSSKAKTSLFLGKMLGGTSGLDYMIYSQGNRRNYKSWASAANDDSWELNNILPYIVKAENFKDRRIMNTPCRAAFHGFKGPIAIKRDHSPMIRNYLSAYEELGVQVVPDLNVHNPVGSTETPFYVDKGYRQSTAYAYISAIKERCNLDILKQTTVSKIIFDRNKTAIGVEAFINGTEKIILRAQKEVIVSAGAINTPKLLMLSGVGPKKHLRSKNINVVSDLPVGKKLQDHASVIIIHNMTKILGSRDFKDPVMYPGNSFTGQVSLNNSNYPECETISFINYPKAMAQYGIIAYEFTKMICDNFFKTKTNTLMLWTDLTNLHPKSRGQVELRSAHFQDSPKVHLGLFTNEDDLNNQVRYIKNFIRIVNTKYFRSMGAVIKHPNIPGCNCQKYSDDEYWKCYSLCVMFPLRRYCGTCAMGSVVDGRLRVRGVRRLRVVDASVIPTIPSGGTFGPTVVIAEKAADMIKQGF